ncbi:MAG: crotonase/enoyl-CoA hydratase family protein [Proteobacteria bacterium]|nr:crotonase/enoyl-CoA hydratase family protein [Pseudomonadota bacterium]
MTERVRIDIKDYVAEVAMTRADKMNAMDPAMFAALAEAGESLKARKDVRAVVLYGEGDHFCAGLDTNSFSQMITGIDKVRKDMRNPPDGEAANVFQKPCYVWQELQVPVIAALQGVVYGGGAQLALAADFRFAASDIRFSIMEGKWGIVPDLGFTQNLFKLVRADQAKDLIMTARILDAAETAKMGLVTRLCNAPLTEARAFAAELAGRSPDAVQGAKRLVEKTWAAAPGEGLRLEGEIQAQIIGYPNQIEAVMANIQKRKPNFS